MRARLYASLFVLAFTTVACGNGGEQASQRPTASPQPTRQSTVNVVMKNYSVSATPASVPAGNVTFDIRITSGFHALSVLRTDLAPDKIPVVGEQAVTFDPRIEVIAADAVSTEDRSLEAQVKPGAYVLICNVADHYQRGMSSGLEVTS
jgi:hypothetical protein